jgi:membrane fusion protein (multidrug efflux system)
VDNPQSVLRPNQFVRARVIGITRPNAVLVPQRAVQQGAKGHFVWVVNQDSKVEPRPVTVGQWHGDDWFINEGLAAGERVVVEGAVALSPGATVQVTQTLAAGQPEATSGAPK